MGRESRSVSSISSSRRDRHNGLWVRPLISVILVVVGLSSAVPLRAQAPITFRYFYDDAGQLTKVVDSTGIVIDYVYDPVGNILDVRRSTSQPGGLTLFNFTPGQGGPLTTVTLQGQGFGGAPSANVVRFNGVVAGVLSATSNTLLVSVPVGASSGLISISVAGTTATSAASFIISAVPVVTSIMPRTIDATPAISPIQITGANLAGATFVFLPAVQPPLLTVGTPQVNAEGTAATLPITVLPSARGQFTLVGTNTAGSSDSFPTMGNTLAVINAESEVDSDGDGFPDGLEVLFGSDPFDAASVPDLTSRGDLLSSALSVSNKSIGLTTQEVIGPAVSVQNLIPSQPLTTQQLVILPQVASRDPLQADAQSLTIQLDSPHNGETVIEGQTITVRATAAGGQPIAAVDFRVNGETFVSDVAFPYELMFTVPAGMANLTFGATAKDAGGDETAAVPVSVVVQTDPFTTITGRVVDTNGDPIERAVVDLLSEGLQAEFFDFAQPLVTLPVLDALTPDRVTRLTAINVRNPNGVFGTDPLGSRAVPDYAARFTGWLAIPTGGAYEFFLGTHQGARLKIGTATVVDLSAGTGQYQERSGTVDLAPGLIPIDITYYEDVGNAELQLSFVPPGGAREVVPPSMLVPGWQPFVAITDSTGAFTLPGVPTASGAIRIRATLANDNRTISASTVEIRLVPQPAASVDNIVITLPR